MDTIAFILNQIISDTKSKSFNTFSSFKVGGDDWTEEYKKKRIELVKIDSRPW